MCNKFEESGLLYVSGELSSAEAREYESHVAACDECRRETEAYRRERAEFYTADILGERPSPAADAEILRLCSAFRKAPAFSTALLFLRKYAPVPVFVMLVAVAVGGYFSYHSMTADSLVAKYGGEATPPPPPSPQPGGADIMRAFPVGDEELAMSDSNLSIQDTNAPFSETRGNLRLEGVVTVKGEGER